MHAVALEGRKGGVARRNGGSQPRRLRCLWLLLVVAFATLATVSAGIAFRRRRRQSFIVAAPNSSTFTTTASSMSTITSVFPPRNWKVERVRSAASLVSGGFYAMRQNVGTNRRGLWLARGLDTNADSAASREKVFKLTAVVAGGRQHSTPRYAIKFHTRMHMTNELSDEVTIDRPWARGFERWSLHPSEDEHLEPCMVLQSERNSRYVRVDPSTRGGLRADAKALDAGTCWQLWRVVSCTTEVECWGEETAFGESPGVPSGNTPPTVTTNIDNRSSLRRGRRRSTVYPLVGTPKPLHTPEPNRTNPYDPTLIATRSIANWAQLPGVASVHFTDDPITIGIIEQLNKRRQRHQLEEEDCGSLPIRVDGQYETLRKFPGFPTYRGLFRRAFELFPSAPLVAFSNGDILYTPSLTQTLDEVMNFVERKQAQVEAAGGVWHGRVLVVGQRINREMPTSWDVPQPHACSGNASGWVQQIESFARTGEIFQSNAEDYFVVSRNLFDWAAKSGPDEVPPFVVGGVAFDNWITQKAVELAKKGNALVIDATKTITALHQNHGSDVRGSHRNKRSVFNSHLAAPATNDGRFDLGHTADAPQATERRSDGSVTVYDKHRVLFE